VTIGSLTDVTTKADLVEFIGALRNDLQLNAKEWENADLNSFLESLAGWIADSDGHYLNQGAKAPAQPDWRFVATALLAAKTYE
jgi:hypothetical protein